jgi:redox-sensitive bicupin YhaK (pirin superfamily)
MPDPPAPALDIRIRTPESLHRASGRVQGGSFEGRWHFSFDQYRDPDHLQFGNLRVLNDDTLSPGAVWPLHPHTQNEVVTYIAAGEFRHEDEHGLGGVLHQGGVQHTTVGRGMYHSEINHRADAPMRFIQLWFIPEALNLPPSVEQREVDRSERTNRWLPLVSSNLPNTLPLRSDASVLASYLEPGAKLDYPVLPGRGLYLYVLDGGPVAAGGRAAPALTAFEVRGSGRCVTTAARAAELLLIDASLAR